MSRCTLKAIKDTILTLFIFSIAWFFYDHSTVTLLNTDNVFLTEIVKISFVIVATYIVMCALIPIGRFILQLIKKIG